MTELPPVLRKVVAGETCAGCGLCAGVDPGIAMARDARGFLRPRATAAPAPETDALMAAACPGARVAPWGEAPAVDPLWGPYHRCLTGFATDREIRHTASSGGVLSALALHLLETGAADRVLHAAMDPKQPLLTAIARSTSRNDVVRAAGSRYAPAAPLAELEAELARPGRIVFIGKPCDAGALRLYLSVRPEHRDRFAAILSFFCAGTPSQLGTDRIIERLGVAPRQVAAFRYRGDGWPGYATAVLADGTSRRLSYAESWGGILSKEVQFRCKICPDAVGGVADVAAADAWYGGETGYPSFDEAEGRSLILTRTARGDRLVAEAEAAGVLATSPLDPGEIEKMQPSQARRKRHLSARMAAVRLTGGFAPHMAGLRLAEAAADERLLPRLKATAGLVRRILQGRR
ncbi:Coenzyme F420 hydrogenase/dehydrogenase, beta subunit C-terminal domain [Thermaurantiacus sp.]